MKNHVLVELNFRRLLQYTEGPLRPEAPYEHAVHCSGYCVDCEQKGLLDGWGYKLYRMSHAADTSDFEALLGPLLPQGEACIGEPVMFVLESPPRDRLPLSATLLLRCATPAAWTQRCPRPPRQR